VQWRCLRRYSDTCTELPYGEAAGCAGALRVFACSNRASVPAAMSLKSQASVARGSLRP
jgi:hypothetical protein